MAYGDRANNSRRDNWLLDFSYNPASPGDWAKLMGQVTVVGAVLLLLKALDGTTCGVVNFNLWLPQTWTNKPGCLIRGLVQEVPDGFLGIEGSSSPSGNVVTPPQPIAPAEPN